MTSCLSSSGGGAQTQNPPKPGDRDWTQSAVYRMIQEEDIRGGRGKPPSQQQQQPQRAPAPAQAPAHAPAHAPAYAPAHAPPPPAPKPHAQTFQQSYTPMDDEFGTSDF